MRKRRWKKKKPTMIDATEKISEVVEIMRDGSGMTHHDVISISLKSGTESVDGLIKKALKALQSTENKIRDDTRQEWIRQEWIQ